MKITTMGGATDAARRLITDTARMSSVSHAGFDGRPIKTAEDLRAGGKGEVRFVTTIEAKNNQALARVRNLVLRKI